MDVPEEDCYDLGLVFSPVIVAIILVGPDLKSSDPWMVVLSIVGIAGGFLLSAFFFREWHKYVLAKQPTV